MRIIYKERTIDPKQFSMVDKATGEEIPFEKGEIKLIGKTDLIKISYKNYVYLDTQKVLDFCEKGLKQHHLGLLAYLSSTLHYKTNACLNSNQEPLSTKAIAQMIGKSENATKSLMNELESFGLVWYGKYANYGKKVYMLNPYFVRKGKEFYKSVGSIFFQDGADPGKSKARSWDKTLKNEDSSPVEEKES
jgi:hypothetical protein